MKIGIVSDTHGLIRPEVLTLFKGVRHILHAGDVGGGNVLAALRAIAPLTVVGGNNDDGSDGTDIVRVTVGAWRVLLTHILPGPDAPRGEVVASLRREPADLVVFGHSHLPHDEVISGVRFFNPASAGPRRFDYPVAVGMINGDRLSHVALDERSNTALRARMNQLSRR
jgi:uncharacterized protein